MISEGSYDTEDWSKHTENSAFHHRNKLHLKYIRIETVNLILVTLHNIIVYCIFDQKI